MHVTEHPDTKEYFQSLKFAEIEVLEIEQAKIIYEEIFGTKGHCYFTISEESWFKKSLYSDAIENRRLLSSFALLFQKHPENLKQLTRVEILKLITHPLDSFLNWEDDDIVYYCIWKEFILKSTWGLFKSNIDIFLECNDECPLLVRYKRPWESLLFGETNRSIIYIKENVLLEVEDTQ